MRTRPVVLVAVVIAWLGLGGPALASETGPVARPRVVSLTFDDERASQGVVGGLLASHRMNGTFYIITRAVQTGNQHTESLTWDQIRQLASDGNEIGGHTQTHPHLPTLSEARQREEICGSRQDLLNRGFDPTSFAYPYGEYTATTEQIVPGCGYASGRTVSDAPETIPPADRYATRAVDSVTDKDQIKDLEGDVTKAPPGAWLQFVFHDIGQPYRGGDQYRITVEHFAAFLDWLGRQRDAGTVVIKTVGSIVARPA